MIAFLILLHSNTPRKESCDRLSCSLKGSGVFTVCSYYNALRGTCAVPFPWKSIWFLKVPKKVSFFVWTTWGKILTCENLIKKVTR